MKILVVDDQRDVRESLANVLTCEGYTTDTAASAEQALQKVASAAPDLIILDMVLPGMSGATFANACSALARVPIIILTGLPTGGEGYLPNVVGVYEKPLIVDKLLEVIRACVK